MKNTTISVMAVNGQQLDLDTNRITVDGVLRCCRFIAEIGKLKPREHFHYKRYSTWSTAKQIWETGSYGLKHWVEEFPHPDGRMYISNEEFIFAAVLCGVSISTTNGTTCSFVFPGYGGAV